jgi:hypothetical protein
VKSEQNRYLYAFIFFVLTRLIAIFFGLPSASDITLYFAYFLNLDSGLLPYSQFSLEYPPLVLVPIFLAGKIDSQSLIDYSAGFSVIMFFADCACLMVCYQYCKNHLRMSDQKISEMIFFYALFGLPMFQLLYQRLDLIVALFLSLSLILFRGSKLIFALSAFFGFFYKIIPALIMPAAIIIKERQPIKIIKNSLIFLIGLFCAIWILEVFTDRNFVKNMLFHAERDIHFESLFGSLILLQNLLVGKISIIYQNYGSFSIKAPEQIINFSKFFGHLILITFYAALFFKFRNRQKVSDEDFLNVSLLTILLFLTFQRVLSPQFFIWLIPLLSIWLAQNYSRKIFLIFLFIFLATWAVFSIDYSALLNQEPILVTILCLRNFVLLGLTIFLTKIFFIDERKSSNLH